MAKAEEFVAKDQRSAVIVVVMIDVRAVRAVDVCRLFLCGRNSAEMTSHARD